MHAGQVAVLGGHCVSMDQSQRPLQQYAGLRVRFSAKVRVMVTVPVSVRVRVNVGRNHCRCAHTVIVFNFNFPFNCGRCAQRLRWTPPPGARWRPRSEPVRYRRFFATHPDAPNTCDLNQPRIQVVIRTQTPKM